MFFKKLCSYFKSLDINYLGVLGGFEKNPSYFLVRQLSCLFFPVSYKKDKFLMQGVFGKDFPW